MDPIRITASKSQQQPATIFAAQGSSNCLPASKCGKSCAPAISDLEEAAKVLIELLARPSICVQPRKREFRAQAARALALAAAELACRHLPVART